jgi:geranylgeranyl pyrophosphate synthase
MMRTIVSYVTNEVNGKPIMDYENLKEKIFEYGEGFLPRFSVEESIEVRRLREASRYTALNRTAGLKRPILSLGSSEMYGIEEDIAMRIAWVCEFIHASSLIMDDLECMDDAKLRRGKRAGHLQYGTHTAVLASHDLRTEATRIITSSDLNSNQKIALEDEIILASDGLLPGQMTDLRGKDDSLSSILKMHRQKTGALISYALRAPAVVALHDDSVVTGFRRYVPGFSRQAILDYQNNMSSDIPILGQIGEDLGLLYQIADDIKDLKLTPEEAGKDTGVDRRNLVIKVGETKARELMEQTTSDIGKNLTKLSKDPRFLEEVIQFIIESAKSV